MIQAVSRNIHNFFEESVDPRTKEKFLVSSVMPTFVLTVIYLISVKYILPYYMRNRPAFRLKKALILYNSFQVVLSAYIVYLSYGSGWVRRYKVLCCRELDQSTTDPDAIMAMNAVYLYFLSKFTEFFDTIFFVLRKKDNQISFLHLYHHASMTFNGYIMARFLPGGHATMISGTNGTIHVVMYTYYLLAGFGPKYQKYLWWKKYLTTFQIIQFVYGLVQAIAITVTWRECPVYMKRYPFFIHYIFYVISMLFLFYRFYQNAYKTEKLKKVKEI